MVKDADIRKYELELKEEVGNEIEVEPKHIRKYGTSNIFQRALSYLFGWTREGRPIKLEATESGSLKVSSVGAGLEQTEKKEGKLTDNAIYRQDFSKAVSRVMIYTKDYDIYFIPSPNGVDFYDPVLCFAGNTLTMDLVVKSFKVQRAENYDTNYYIVGMR